MNYKSKYNINFEGNWGQNWIKEDLMWTLSKIETMPRNNLIALCELPEIQLSFTAENWGKTTPEEQIILALIIDYSPQILISAIKKII